jgi:hypothetical protein
VTGVPVPLAIVGVGVRVGVAVGTGVEVLAGVPVPAGRVRVTVTLDGGVEVPSSSGVGVWGGTAVVVPLSGVEVAAPGVRVPTPVFVACTEAVATTVRVRSTVRVNGGAVPVRSGVRCCAVGEGSYGCPSLAVGSKKPSATAQSAANVTLMTRMRPSARPVAW